jgi:hypothetical protein
VCAYEQQQQARSLASSLQGEQQGKPSQNPVHVPSGGLAHLVAAAMHPTESEHKDWLHRQQHQLASTNASSNGSQRVSADQDVSLLRFQGAGSARAGSANAGTSVNNAAAPNGLNGSSGEHG